VSDGDTDNTDRRDKTITPEAERDSDWDWGSVLDLELPSERAPESGCPSVLELESAPDWVLESASGWVLVLVAESDSAQASAEQE